MTEIEIFRAGRHTAMSGETLDFTATDLAEIAAGYDLTLHEAPAVVGHPRHDLPAYGWIKGMRADGDRLLAELDQVDPQFAELVKAGRYKKLSAAFYPPDAPSNPKPGQYYLRHIGFLGAQPPAVKGLKPPVFAERERFVTFGEVPDGSLLRLFRRLRDWIVSTSGLETADQVLPADELNWLSDQAAQPETTDEDDVMTQTAFAEREARLAEQERKTRASAEQLEEDRTAFAEREAKLRRTEIEGFLDGMIKAGKLAPSLKPGLAAFMERLAGAETALEFAEGEKGETRTIAPLDFFKGLLEKAPQLVSFAEVARPEPADRPAGDFALAPGAVADRAKLEIHGKALAFMEANKGTDYLTAVRRVSAS
jgi:hypothetical protein